MRYYLRYRQWLLWGMIVTSVSLTLTAAASATLLIRYQNASNYPGATLVSDRTIYNLTPRPAMRYDASYRTNDKFSDVYNWYSSQFSLGPETYAQSSCALMARSSAAFIVFERQTSVMVCDTANGRLVFVMRSVMLRHW